MASNMRETTLPHNCHLCGKPTDEVLAHEDDRTVRAGWLCTTCWPKDGSWTKAIGRERSYKETRHD
jgi:hypothetical protein